MSLLKFDKVIFSFDSCISDGYIRLSKTPIGVILRRYWFLKESSTTRITSYFSISATITLLTSDTWLTLITDNFNYFWIFIDFVIFLRISHYFSINLFRDFHNYYEFDELTDLKNSAYLIKSEIFFRLHWAIYINNLIVISKVTLISMAQLRVSCGRTGYTGPRHDPPDPSAYSTHTSLALLLASCSRLVEVYPSF